MTIEHPFKHLRRDLRAAQVMAIMLLGIKEIDWGANNYVFYIGLERATKQQKNPTRVRMIAAVVMWFTFVQTLIEALPDNDYKARVQAEYDKATAEYKYLMVKA